MESYRPRDVTFEAHRIVQEWHGSRRHEVPGPFRLPVPRIPLPQSVSATTETGRQKIRVRDVDEIRIGLGRFRSAFGNWQLSAVVTLQDGTPLSPEYFASDFANTGTLNRPNIVPGQSITLPRSERTATHFFNTAAFSDPAPYTFGNAGRNIIPGPGNNIFDLAAQKKVPFGETKALEFRAEFFNAFNHPNWGIPLPFADFGPFFGRIASTGDPRRAQFALRLEF